jgi:hypothetical protein
MISLMMREDQQLSDRHEAEQRAAQEIAEFYAGDRAPLPESLMVRRRP